MTLNYFPPIEPYETGALALDGRHVMYWEQSGNPAGIPVLVLHGGPGSGSNPDQRRTFDPAAYRIILFDQRGAGRSRPAAEIIDNTTELLICDIERLRERLGVERWLVIGGSWGSALALAYAEAHPGRVRGLILRGVFLARPSEIDWWLYGMGMIFPEAKAAFEGYIPAAERGDLLAAYHRRLSDPDPAVHEPAARAWSHYEVSCGTLLTDDAALAVLRHSNAAVTMARIECHYFATETYFQRRPILAHLDVIRAIPAIIIQGRYDIICPIITADELARAWPQARYVIVPDAGHREREPGIRSAQIAAGEAFKGTGSFAGV